MTPRVAWTSYMEAEADDMVDALLELCFMMAAAKDSPAWTARGYGFPDYLTLEEVSRFGFEDMENIKLSEKDRRRFLRLAKQEWWAGLFKQEET